MPALAKCIEIGDEDRAELERIVRSTTAQVRMVERARIVLSAAEGRSAAEIGQLVGCSVNTAQKWRSRYEHDGIDALGDLPRSGKPLIYSQQDRARLIAKACTRPPETPEGAQQERWTYEQLGEAVGMSGSQAHVILSRAEVKPHLTDHWIMSDLEPIRITRQDSGACRRSWPAWTTALQRLRCWSPPAVTRRWGVQGTARWRVCFGSRMRCGSGSSR